MLRLIQIITALVVLFGVIYRFLPFGSAHKIQDYPTVEISQLINNSKGYDGHAITVEGTVAGNAGVLGYGGYRLRQGENEILIISTRGIPSNGSRITVSGTFKQAFVVNNYSYMVILEK